MRCLQVRVGAQGHSGQQVFSGDNVPGDRTGQEGSEQPHPPQQRVETTKHLLERDGHLSTLLRRPPWSSPGSPPPPLSQGEGYSEGPSLSAFPRLRDDVLAPVSVEQRGTLTSSAATLPHTLPLRMPGGSAGWTAAGREPLFHSSSPLFRIVKHPQRGC